MSRPQAQCSSTWASRIGGVNGGTNGGTNGGMNGGMNDGMNGDSTPPTPTTSSSGAAAKILAGLAGQLVSLDLVDGTRVQGILSANSTPDKYVLTLAQVAPASALATRNCNPVQAEQSFSGGQVALFSVLAPEAKDDPDEVPATAAAAATVAAPTSGFRTDAEIASSATDPTHRNLEKWDDGACVDGAGLMTLDQEAQRRPSDRGWNQFEVNKKLFGYESSYVEEDYTTKVDRQSDFYRRNEMRATQLAREIQGQSSKGVSAHVAEERGGTVGHDDDEEARYSSVLDNQAAGKYRPPAMRARSPAPPSSSSPDLVAPRSPSPAVETPPATTDAAPSSPPPSKLNPDAKSFSLNVTAKEFVPSFGAAGPFASSLMPVIMAQVPIVPPLFSIQPQQFGMTPAAFFAPNGYYPGGPLPSPVFYTGAHQGMPPMQYGDGPPPHRSSGYFQQGSGNRYPKQPPTNHEH